MTRYLYQTWLCGGWRDVMLYLTPEEALSHLLRDQEEHPGRPRRLLTYVLAGTLYQAAPLPEPYAREEDAR